MSRNTGGPGESSATAEQIKLANQPLVGSGAIESTCRQYQVRFKRAGQFWSLPGDQSLLALETLHRNGRWQWLFAHAQPLGTPCPKLNQK